MQKPYIVPHKNLVHTYVQNMFISYKLKCFSQRWVGGICLHTQMNQIDSVEFAYKHWSTWLGEISLHTDGSTGLSGICLLKEKSQLDSVEFAYTPRWVNLTQWNLLTHRDGSTWLGGICTVCDSKMCFLQEFREIILTPEEINKTFLFILLFSASIHFHIKCK